MKKVININFQGRVVPIEETAYELLKQYVESLRKYFSSEEGRDEIINDIESRIAELFSERLKKGAVCITDDDVNAVIAGMGRPEDFEAEASETIPGAQQQRSQQSQQSQQQSQQNYSYATSTRGRLYRNADDKVIGGVCSGLASYFRIDPAVMRIVFVLLFFTGPGFLLYIILWLIIPAQSLRTNITKRLYRSADNKVVAGVAGGLAAYFNIDVWIPRLIFALPLLVWIFSGPFGLWWGDWHMWWGPKVVTDSVGGTLTLTYIILWIALPIATTAAEKLEMRGEKVDLNSIRNTVKEDLETLKTKAQSLGTEIKESAVQMGERAKQFGQTAGTQAKTYSTEARGAASGIGHVIGVLFKAFFIFVGGVIAIAFLAVLATLFGVGIALIPFKAYFLDNSWQYLMAWGTLIFFLGIPVLSFLVWIVRKIAGSKRNPYISYAFGFLWIIGLFCFIALLATFSRNFSGGARVQNDFTFSAPVADRLTIKVASPPVRYYGGWLNFSDEVRFTDDSLELSNVGLKVRKSVDSSYHLYYTKYSNGRNDAQAEQLAKDIAYSMSQQDSVVYIDKGLSIKRGQRFRNQHVIVTVQVPVGKRLIVAKNVSRKINRWFHLGVDNTHNGWDGDWDWDSEDESNWVWGDWNEDVEYMMTPTGLERTDRLDEKELKQGRYKLKAENDDQRTETDSIDQKRTDSAAQPKKQKYHNIKPESRRDSAANKTATTSAEIGQERESIAIKTKTSFSEFASPLTIFARIDY